MPLVHESPLSGSNGNIYVVPILPGKLECAQEVQRQFFALRPDAIAVEFPKTLETPITRATRRLPFLSVVLYQEADGTSVYLPIEPTDGLVEAVRLGADYQIPVFFVDRDTEGVPRIQQSMPDPYSITKIGYHTYCEAYRQIVDGTRPIEIPIPNPRKMAIHYLRRPGKRSCVRCLRSFQREAPHNLRGTVLRGKHPIIRRRSQGVAEVRSPKIHKRYFRRAYIKRRASEPEMARERTMAYHLQRLRKQYASVLFVCELAHYATVWDLLDMPLAQPIGRVKRDKVMIANLHEDSSREIMSEIPFIAAEYERNRLSMEPLDRLKLQEALIQQARQQHLMNSKEEITPQQLSVLRKFARNYALLHHQLTPDFYQLVIAARGAVNDNYAYEVWDLGSTYPWQDPNPRFATIELRGEDLYLNQKKIRFHRKFRTLRKRLVPVPVKIRKKEKRKGEWKEKWEGKHICSYPPEDIVIEGYGRYVQKKTTRMLAEGNHRTLPFTSTLMDGIDMRETIRNWHEKKLYVMENVPVRGKVGSVVIIFAEDSASDWQLKQSTINNQQSTIQERYPWKMTWLGEHEEESDMAFYATLAGEHVIGPGISRCVYGGLMLTYPPMRVYNIWKDPFFDMAKSKSERLLLAAIDYSEEALIAYVAAKPPRSWCYSFANKMNKKVVYIPIGQFSPVMLKKIQVFHVLDGYEVRQYAKEYIW